ncbi:MAG: lysophospholipid acyltransferase family protein [Flavobacteriales bacterium]|nr:lysophospholipid acyltransferase family protein [Flavobacteriales bacterium]
MLYHIIGYRRKVVKSNLRSVFSDWSSTQINQTEKSFYKNLAHVLIESACVFALDKKALMKRVNVINPEVLDQLAEQNISAMFLGGHIANWEWGGMATGNFSPMHNLAVYLPLKNKFFDKMMRKTRSRLTQIDTLVASRNLYKAVLNTPRPFQVYILADQSPSREHHHRVDFLGKSTAFFDGPAKMIHKLKLGAVYLETRRIRSGYYEVELYPLFHDGSSLSAEKITEMYVRKLEESILKNPSDWLWSHKRWKF